MQRPEWDIGIIWDPWEDRGRISVRQLPDGRFEIYHYRFFGPPEGEKRVAVFDDFETARNYAEAEMDWWRSHSLP